MESKDLKSINKTNWLTYRFDQIADKISKTVDPGETDSSIYIGLEHLDSDCIHIKRRGIPSDVSGGKLKCYPGDVIFGKRRAYQRKAAIVDFEGICSAHSFVLRAKPEVITPELFPFFMHSDSFMNRAIDISVGGLSPTINWGQLKEQKFLLPPKDQQAKLTELLWAMDEMIESDLNLKIRYEVFLKCFHFDSVSGASSKTKTQWKGYAFGDLGEFFGGLNGKSKNDFGEGEPFINYMNVFKNSRVDPKQVNYVKISKGERQNTLKYGDIILTGSSETLEEVGMSSVVLDDLIGYYLNSFCFGFRLHDFKTLLPGYARFLMRGREVREFMSKHAQGYTRFNLSKSIVKEKLRIYLPEITEQNEIAEKLDFLEAQTATLETRIARSKELQKVLINQIF